MPISERLGAHRGRILAAGTAAVAAGILLVGCVATPAPTTTSAGESTPAPLPADVAAALEAVVDAGAVAATITVRDGDETVSASQGTADLESGRAAEPDDPVRIASITKTVLATVIVQLVDDGELAFDTTVESVLPGLLPTAPGDVTVEQLLAHTSGIPDYVATITPDAASAAAVTDEEFEPAGLVATALEQPWLAEPGAEFHYSNAGYVVLGLVAEAVTGSSVPQLMDERVFEPVGMGDTSYPTDTEMPDDALRGYLTLDGERVESTRTSPSFWSYGAALTSTTDDVSALVAALGDGLVSADSLARMQQVGASGYGLGLLAGVDACGAEPPELVFGQRGNGFGYNAMTLGSPDGERVVTIAYTGGTFDPAADPVFPAVNEALIAALASTCP